MNLTPEQNEACALLWLRNLGLERRPAHEWSIKFIPGDGYIVDVSFNGGLAVGVGDTLHTAVLDVMPKIGA